jgi:peptide-methionine (R)-S-oxide reductase
MHSRLGEEMTMKSTIDLVPARRAVLVTGLSVLTIGIFGAKTRADTYAAAASQVAIENFEPSGKSLGVVQVAKVVKTDAEWRAMLSPDSYDITRRAGTERPGTGKYAYNHSDGLYRCICCDTALYDSKTKFESGTGWPSFWQPISQKNVAKASDHSIGMIRDAISCSRCDAHLGHVFDDGPKPTGLRYCMNSVALNFVARA